MNLPSQPMPLQRTAAGMTFGVLLPHFGPHTSRQRLFSGVRLIEELGFDAVWARDHLLWRPHTHEAQADVTFLEQQSTLSAIAAVTERIHLGTGVMIPVRTPIQAAQQLATLSFLSDGRVIAGIGSGHEPAELAAAGVEPGKRKQAVIELMGIVRRLWAEDHVSFDGEVYQVADVTLRPRPVRPIPILYGGPSKLAVRLAVAHADGWLAGTVPFETLDARLATLHELADRAGKQMWLGAVPRTVIGLDRAAVRAKVDVEAMSHDGWRNWETPRSGAFSTIEDIRGAVLAGEPADIVDGILDYARRGFDHFSFDVRNQFDRFEETLELIAERVLPEARAATAVPAGLVHQ